MAKRQVFFSFHFDNDVMRVQTIRNIGSIEGNTPVSPQAWETARNTPGAIEKWIDDNMKYKSCVVVLIGSETAGRPWVEHEIVKGWNDKKGVLGIYIHNIKCAQKVRQGYSGTCTMGQNPFDNVTLKGSGQKLSTIVKCYNPNPVDPYNDIAANIETWIEAAIKARQ